jgi:hypothetical protein
MEGRWVTHRRTDRFARIMPHAPGQLTFIGAGTGQIEAPIG